MTPLASVSVSGRLPRMSSAAPHDLRLAAQAVGILHALVACQVRSRGSPNPAISPVMPPPFSDLTLCAGAGDGCADRTAHQRAAPSVDAPVTSAAPNRFSTSNKPASASA